MSTTAVNYRAVDLAALQADLGGPEWLAEIRFAARGRFDSMGWPTTSEEEWRRTSLRAFDFDAYTAVPRTDRAGSASTESSESESLSALLRYRDGVVSDSHRDESVADSVVIGDLAELEAGLPQRVVTMIRRALERSVREADNRVELWHYGLLESVAVVYVPRGVCIERPVLVEFEVYGDERVTAPHLVVVLEEGASANVVKAIRSAAGEGETLVLDADELILGTAASLRYLVSQSLNDESLYFGNSRGNVGRDAVINRTESVLGAAFVKARYVSEITGAGAQATLNGIYFAVDDQHIDLRTVQHHRAKQSNSRAFYRGAVRDAGHVIYQGLIQVAPEAPGTDAYLTNKNLVLADGARADSIPSLNIATDDVRCSHGSTTGRLDAGQIFYLKARGIPESEARSMLVEGYFEDLISRLPEGFQEEIRDRIVERILRPE